MINDVAMIAEIAWMGKDRQGETGVPGDGRAPRRGCL